MERMTVTGENLRAAQDSPCLLINTGKIKSCGAIQVGVYRRKGLGSGIFSALFIPPTNTRRGKVP